MNILHIHPSMSGGGIEAMITALANEMTNQGHKVTVCSIFSPKDDDVFWFRLSTGIQKCTLGKVEEGLSLRSLYEVYRFIRNGHFDVIHIHGFLYYYYLPILMFHKRSKFFYTVHSDAEKENSKWDVRLFKIKKMLFKRRLVHPVSISRVSNLSFKNVYGFDAYVVPNGIATPRLLDIDLVRPYKITVSTRVFINPGRITEAKNQIVLCRVFQKLISENKDVVLLIAGDKQDEEIFHNLQTYFCDRIIYIGVVHEIPTLVSQCDAMCLPSIWEGLPVTLLESLSVGCIPICAPVGGIPEVITNGVNGILSTSSSYEDYYNAVHRFLSLSIEEIESMKIQCLQRFKNYEVSTTSKSYLSLYETV